MQSTQLSQFKKAGVFIALGQLFGAFSNLGNAVSLLTDQEASVAGKLMSLSDLGLYSGIFILFFGIFLAADGINNRLITINSLILLTAFITNDFANMLPIRILGMLDWIVIFIIINALHKDRTSGSLKYFSLLPIPLYLFSLWLPYRADTALFFKEISIESNLMLSLVLHLVGLLMFTLGVVIRCNETGTGHKSTSVS